MITDKDPFHALGDRTRRQILELLGESELAVRAIAASFSVSRPAISRHLRVLRESGLVEEERRGRERFYRLRRGPLVEAGAWIEGLAAGNGTARPAPERGSPARDAREPRRQAAEAGTEGDGLLAGREAAQAQARPQTRQAEPRAPEAAPEEDWRSW